MHLTLFGASGDAPADNSGQEAMVPTRGEAREIVTKQLELLHETAPSAQTIGFLINATNPYVELDVQDVAAASDRLRRKLVVCE